MKIGSKRALGIVTYNRSEYFRKILETTRYKEVDKVYILDASGTNVERNKARLIPLGSDNMSYVPNDSQVTVGVAKNMLLTAMMEDGMDHLFLQEDDVVIEKDGVFDLYIDTAQVSGMWCGLNYAWHGHGNKGNMGELLTKNEVDYGEDLGIVLTENGTAAFSYFHRSIIESLGMFDEFYDNAWEHLDHYQKAASYKRTLYFNCLPDANGSEEYIRDLDDGKHGGSVIRKDEEWLGNMKIGAEHFKKKFGFYPTNLPRATDTQVLERLEYLSEKYGS